MSDRRLPRREGGTIAIPFDRATKPGEAKGLQDLGADVFELRLDLAEIHSPEAAEEMAATFADVPLICTCRSADEGGKGGEGYERLLLIASTVNYADAIDVELESTSILPQASMLAENNKCELIVSHHDMSGTPDLDFMEELVQRSSAAGADIVKIVTTTKEEKDVDILAELLERTKDKGIDLAVMGMGGTEVAKQSRLRLAKLGSTFVFASAELESAPGQPALSWLDEKLGRNT